MQQWSLHNFQCHFVTSSHALPAPSDDPASIFQLPALSDDCTMALCAHSSSSVASDPPKIPQVSQLSDWLSLWDRQCVSQTNCSCTLISQVRWSCSFFSQVVAGYCATDEVHPQHSALQLRNSRANQLRWCHNSVCRLHSHIAHWL